MACCCHQMYSATHMRISACIYFIVIQQDQLSLCDSLWLLPMLDPKYMLKIICQTMMNMRYLSYSGHEQGVSQAGQKIKDVCDKNNPLLLLSLQKEWIIASSDYLLSSFVCVTCKTFQPFGRSDILSFLPLDTLPAHQFVRLCILYF